MRHYALQTSKMLFWFILLQKRWFMSPAECRSQARLEGKTVIVTGSNTGIGKETALDLAKRGARVILACRDANKAEKAARDIQNVTGYSNKVKVMQLDLGSLSSVREFVKKFELEEERLDILVNNAGMLGIPHTLSEDGIEMILAVNHIGHFLLTNLLLDKLKACAPSRVVNVSALAHTFVNSMSFEDFNLDKSYKGWTAYCRSKLANVLFTRQLAKKLQDSGVTTYALHPGIIMSDLGRRLWVKKVPGLRHLVEVMLWMFTLNVRQGAQTTIFCCVTEELDHVTGKYYSNCAEARISSAAADDAAAQRLWDISEKLTGLTEEKE